MKKHYDLQEVRSGPIMVSRERFFSEDEMYLHIEQVAKKEQFVDTLAALPYAKAKHEGQKRKGEENIPYFYHPLLVTVHASTIGLATDEMLATCLLHDVCEDCGVLPEELPVSEKVQHLVALLTRPTDETLSWKEKLERYYGGIRTEKTACLVKLLDRCHNLSSMAAVFNKQKMDGYLAETIQYILPLIETVLEMDPTMDKPCFALRYHMLSVMNTVDCLI